MYGAILGDIIGSPYEYDKGKKRKDLPLFCGQSRVTDDTMMTVAVADALMSEPDPYDDDSLRYAFINRMRYWGRLYPGVGYGSAFRKWLISENPKPYESYGNGSAMRVSPVGWLFDTLDLTRHIAALSAEVTHNHPEGIKGAEAVASAVYLARTGSSKDDIAAYISDEFHYNLDRTIEEIRPGYRMNATCQGSVPEAMIAFLESTSFEDTIRTTISLGGDTDTTSAIAGSIAEAFFGIPRGLKEEVFRYTRPCVQKVIRAFTACAEAGRETAIVKAS